MLAAWRGQEAAAFSAMEAGSRTRSPGCHQRTLRFTNCMTAVLFNGLGRYREALAAAQRACDGEDFGLFGWALSELVEAAVRSDSREVASEALDRLGNELAPAARSGRWGSRRARGRCLSDGEMAQRASSGGDRAAQPYPDPRPTRPGTSGVRRVAADGEPPRRRPRAVARGHADVHISIGMEAFAERARGELLATGETVASGPLEELATI